MRQIKKNWKYGAIALAFIVFAFMPYFRNGLPLYDDDSFHLYRIYSIGNEIKNGIWFSKIHYLMCYGYGYGSGFFYQDGLLYIPGILVALGVRLDLAYKIFAFILLCLIYWNTFYGSYRITNKIETAQIAAVIAITTFPILSGFHRGFSMGRLCGAVFMPLALAGMYIYWVKGESTRLLIIGMTGLLYSQAIGTFMTVIACAGIALLHFNQLKKTGKFKGLLRAILIVLMLGAPYWLQMLEQMRKQKFKVSAPWTIAAENVPTIQEAIWSKVNMGPMMTMSILLSIAVIVYMIIINNWDKAEDYKVAASTFSILAIVYVLVSLCKPFWNFWNLQVGISVIQFPNRLYTETTFLTAYALAGCVAMLQDAVKIGKYKKHLPLAILMVIGCITITTAPGMMRLEEPTYASDDEYSRVFQIEHNIIAGIGAGEEWLPMAASRDSMTHAYEAIDQNGNTVRGERSKGMSVFTFDADLAQDYYEVPFIYYKGYQAETASGDRLIVDEVSENGNVKIMMPEMQEGVTKITVRYKHTVYQMMTYAIALLGLTYWGSSEYFARAKNKNDVKQTN